MMRIIHNRRIPAILSSRVTIFYLLRACDVVHSDDIVAFVRVCVCMYVPSDMRANNGQSKRFQSQGLRAARSAALCDERIVCPL